MASIVMILFLSLLSVAVVPSTLAATTYEVCGDSGGWVLGCNGDGWASRYTFYEGDILHFTFKRHRTVAVTRDYKKYALCELDNSGIITVDKSGNFTFTLAQSGAYFFISTGHKDCTKYSLKMLAPVFSIIPPH